MNDSFIKPIQHSRLEAIAVRAAFAWVVWGIWSNKGYAFMPYAEHTVPHGLAKTFGLDFSFLADPDPVIFEWPAYAALRALAALALLVYALGFVPWLCLGYVTAFLVAFGTLINSQGSITHHMQLTAMTLVGITVYHLYHRLRYLKPDTQSPDPFRRTIQVGQLVIVGAYVSSAISKITASGFLDWITGTTNFPAQLVKAERMHYYNDLTTVDPKVLPFMESISVWLGDLLTANPNLAPFIIGPGLIIELFAFVLVFGRKWNVYGAVAVIVFHMFVGALMNLHFDSNIQLILTFFVLPNIIYWAYGRYQEQRPAAANPPKKPARAHRQKA